MVKKVLFVLSSHEQLGNTGKQTGWYLAEAAHPHHVLTSKGIEVEFTSPAGGKAPLDESSKSEDYLKDEVNKHFFNDPKIQSLVSNTKKASEVKINEYDAILYVGGHGVMWDFADNETLVKLGEAIWAKGGVVAAVCHGPAGVINLKDEKGEILVKGKNVAGFSNDEEEAIGLTKVVPYSLEDRLKGQGANYSKGDKWTSHVVVDGRLVTGQNPQSANAVGEAIAKLLA